MFEYRFDYNSLVSVIDDLLTRHLERVVRRKRRRQQLSKDHPSVIVIDLQDLRLSNLEPNLEYIKQHLGRLMASSYQDVSGVGLFIDGQRYLAPRGVSTVHITYNEYALDGCRLSDWFISKVKGLSHR